MTRGRKKNDTWPKKMTSDGTTMTVTDQWTVKQSQLQITNIFTDFIIELT